MTSISKSSHEGASISSGPPQVEAQDAGTKATTSQLKKQASSSVQSTTTSEGSQEFVEANQTPTIPSAQQRQTGEEFIPKSLQESEGIIAAVDVKLIPAHTGDDGGDEDDDEDEEGDAINVVRLKSLDRVINKLVAKKAAESRGKMKDNGEADEENDAGEEEREEQNLGDTDDQEEEGGGQGGAAEAGEEEAQVDGEGQSGNGAEEETDEGIVEEEERGDGGEEERDDGGEGPVVVHAARPRISKGYRAKPCFVQMIAEALNHYRHDSKGTTPTSIKGWIAYTYNIDNITMKANFKDALD
ncbi:hypothetical protein BG015_001380, partial [Linnemannia schmuckeri]